MFYLQEVAQSKMVTKKHTTNYITAVCVLMTDSQLSFI